MSARLLSPGHQLTMFAGGVTHVIGGCVSLMVMICTQLVELVQSSVTVCLRIIVPPQMPPTSGPSVQVYPRVASQLSEAVPPCAMNSARFAGHGGTLVGHCTVIFVGHVMV